MRHVWYKVRKLGLEVGHNTPDSLPKLGKQSLSLWCELRMEMKREEMSQYHQLGQSTPCHNHRGKRESLVELIAIYC